MELLQVVLDVSTAPWRRRAPLEGLAETADALLVFVNAHLLVHRENQLRVLATRDGGETLVLNPFAAAMATSWFQRLVDDAQQPATAATAVPGAGSLARVLSQALCFVNRARQRHANLAARVLVLQISADVDADYNPVLNAVFAAQKMNVVIDSCVLSEPSTFLQQASHLTRGIHLQLQRQPLLSKLLTVFLPSVEHRSVLQTPDLPSVDLRAACFCHRTAVDVAFVCSVCLGIFCQRGTECPTCHTRIDPKPTAAAAPSRKRPLGA